MAGPEEDINQPQQQHNIRILQVRVYDPHRPITAKVLHQLFSPHGYVEKIVMFPDLGSDLLHVYVSIHFHFRFLFQ